MVVIKTWSSELSEYLANYLNLDIIEKLATRRATGGTRPALDYKALKSIPIIENIDFQKNTAECRIYVFRNQNKKLRNKILPGSIAAF